MTKIKTDPQTILLDWGYYEDLKERCNNVMRLEKEIRRLQEENNLLKKQNEVLHNHRKI